MRATARRFSARSRRRSCASCSIRASASSDVVALSGGADHLERVRARAGQATKSLWLDVDLRARLAARQGQGRRPLARERERFEALHEARLPLYASVARAMIPAGARQAMPRAFDALAALRHAPAGARMLWAVSRSAEYPVWIGRGLLGAVPGDVATRTKTARAVSA